MKHWRTLFTSNDAKYHQGLGKNGRLVEHKYWKGNGPLLSKILGNHQHLNRPSLWQSLGAKALEIIAQKEKEVLTTRQADAGAMPRMACYLVIGKGFGNPRQRG